MSKNKAIKLKGQKVMDEKQSEDREQKSIEQPQESVQQTTTAVNPDSQSQGQDKDMKPEMLGTDKQMPADADDEQAHSKVDAHEHMDDLEHLPEESNEYADQVGDQ